jgi:hypothetical protein
VTNDQRNYISGTTIGLLIDNFGVTRATVFRLLVEEGPDRAIDFIQTQRSEIDKEAEGEER